MPILRGLIKGIGWIFSPHSMLLAAEAGRDGRELG